MLYISEKSDYNSVKINKCFQKFNDIIKDV